MRGGDLAGVVAFAGFDVEAFAFHANFDGVVFGGGVGAAGHIGEGVLVSGLFGEAGVKLPKTLLFRGVIDLTTGMVRIANQGRPFAVDRGDLRSK